MDPIVNDSVFQPLQSVADNLSEADYNRQRLSPELKDRHYVHLSDIRLFLDQYSHESFGSLLDYGCGGSPYRQLFKTNNYIRADYVDCGNLDCVIGPDGKLALEDNSCDAVLSTQVLEHVFSPQVYLAEAFRVLRPGGRLILSTHGTWQDHGCPYDFRRWTYDGLRRELQEAGFHVGRLSKLTTGPRAVIFLFVEIIDRVEAKSGHLSGWVFRLLRRVIFGFRGKRHKWMDRQFVANRIVAEGKAGHELYLALGIEGVKPQPNARGVA
jgi:SAM-dependent methyltransferase